MRGTYAEVRFLTSADFQPFEERDGKVLYNREECMIVACCAITPACTYKLKSRFQSYACGFEIGDVIVPFAICLPDGQMVPFPCPASLPGRDENCTIILVAARHPPQQTQSQVTRSLVFVYDNIKNLRKLDAITSRQYLRKIDQRTLYDHIKKGAIQIGQGDNNLARDMASL